MPQYKVHVCRTAYGHLDIPVHAESEKEAMRLAVEEAGNHLFSESTSEYTAEGCIIQKGPKVS